MVFSSLHHGAAAAIVPLDRTVTTRPHPHPNATLALEGQEVLMRDASRNVADLKRVTTPPKPARKKTKKSEAKEADSTSETSAGQTKKLSTERSRLCRQRQKNYADTLQTAVAAVRAQVADLIALRDLRREQLVHTPVSRSGSLARIVEEYCTVFQHGMAPDTGASMMLLTGRKRSLSLSRQLTAQQQCDFLLSIMDPEVQVFDWIGRSKTGPDPLVHGWKAWSSWHAGLTFQLQNIDVVEASNETIAVSTYGKLCVRVSPTTIQQLFPHVAEDQPLCELLLGAEIQYPFRDTFYFNDTGRVVKYTVDMDLVAALGAIIKDFKQVAHLVAPPNAASFSDRAVCTYDGCSLEEVRACSPHPQYQAPVRDERLNLQYLLS